MGHEGGTAQRATRIRKARGACSLDIRGPFETIGASGWEGEMFKLRPDISDEDVVARARSAEGAGERWFQVLAPHVGERSLEDAEFEAARLVDLLEGERWTLENAAYSAEYDERRVFDRGPYGFLAAPTIVGTIYTFALREAP
jgi:hypothetical protein